MSLASVVSHLEDDAVARLGVSTSGCTVLDVGCGTRGIPAGAAELAVGVDLSPETLQRSAGMGLLAAADVRALPFPALTFDIVYCRLAIGHVREMERAYAELSRVCCMGGVVIVSDLGVESLPKVSTPVSPDAERATPALEHFTHSIERQAVAAYDVGLRLERRQDGVVDATVRHMFADAGLQPEYERLLGVPMVLALLWRKNSS